MITISRVLARQYRAVLRRALMADNPRSRWPAVICRAGAAGLTLESRQGEVAIRYYQEGALAEDALAISGSLLADFEGRGDVPVTLESTEVDRGRATWTERGVPQMVDFPLVPSDQQPTFPEAPSRFWPQPPAFLKALAEASASAARESVRFAVSRIQLRGIAGEVVGTDGKQLLLEGGFNFAWRDDLLIPALSVYAAPELATEGPIQIGRTDSDLVLSIGRWTLAIRIDKDGRFPTVEAVIPKLSAVKSRLRFHADDAQYVADLLPKLPGAADDHSPVQLDLGRAPALRAGPEAGGQVIEIALARSSASGAPTQIRTDRQYLQRALRMGFTELQYVKVGAPLVCRDRHRCYVWMGLDPKEAVPAEAEIVRLSTTDLPAQTPAAMPPADSEVPALVAASDTDAQPAPATPVNLDDSTSPPISIRRTNHMNSSPNGSHGPRTAAAAEAPAPGGLPDIIAETEALRDLLHDAFSRTARLLAALKLQRKQTRAVQQAMASLKQLQIDR